MTRRNRFNKYSTQLILGLFMGAFILIAFAPASLASEAASNTSLPKIRNTEGSKLDKTFKKIEKKIGRIYLSENVYFKLNPNPKKILSLNVKF